MLCVTIDNKLTFESHLKNIRQKANQKLNALVTVANLRLPFQRKVLLESFIKFQFSYFPLICIFSSTVLNKTMVYFMKNLSD